MHVLAPSAPADVRALLESLAIPAAKGASHGGRAPERVLGEALSLPETVRLADGLSHAPAAHGGPPSPSLDRDALLAPAAQRLAALRQRIERRFAAALAGEGALPGPARLHALLAEGDADAAGRGKPKNRRPSPIAQTCVELFEAAVSELHREVDRAVEAVRSAALRACPRSRLLALDRLVDPVITRELRLAERGLVRAYEHGCASQLEAALRQLAPGCDLETVAALYAPQGALGRMLHETQRLLLALLDLEWARVQGLLEALCVEQGLCAENRELG